VSACILAHCAIVFVERVFSNFRGTYQIASLQNALDRRTNQQIESMASSSPHPVTEHLGLDDVYEQSPLLHAGFRPRAPPSLPKRTKVNSRGSTSRDRRSPSSRRSPVFEHEAFADIAELSDGFSTTTY